MIFAKYLPHLYQGADHKGHRTYNMGGGGGGGGPTQSTVTQTSVPEWLRPQTEAVLGAGMQEYFDATPRRVTNPLTGETTTEYDITGTKPYTPYSQNAADYFAPFSQQQQQVFGETAGMRTPGGFQTGQQMTGMAGQGGLDTVGSAFGYGGQGAGYGGQGAMFGQQAAGTGGMYERMATDPMSMQAYMSPYMQNVVEIQKQQAIEDAQRAQLGANLGAARQGTYGGARQTLAQTQREAALNKQLSDIQAQGLQSAFDQAQKSQQFGVTSGLQGLQAGISGAQTGIQGAGMGLQGVQGAQAGFGLLGRMGEQAANIGAAQQQADIARLGFQGQMGDIQQQRQQDIINQQIQNFALAQEMPSQRLSAFNALLRGYATPTSTVSQYQAQPSGLQQLAGLGTTAAGIGTIAGMGKKEGGAIKLAEGGGITDKDALESFAERASIPQLQQSMQSGELKGKEYIGAPILQNKIVNEERMKAAQAAMAGGQQQGSGSILDGLLANADQLQGITAIAEPAPVMAAGGGIVAFQAGGLSFSDVMRQATLQEQRDYQRTGVPSARLQSKEAELTRQAQITAANIAAGKLTDLKFYADEKLKAQNGDKEAQIRVGAIDNFLQQSALGRNIVAQQGVEVREKAIDVNLYNNAVEYTDSKIGRGGSRYNEYKQLQQKDKENAAKGNPTTLAEDLENTIRDTYIRKAQGQKQAQSGAAPQGAGGKESPLPMPKTAAEAVDGKVYMTAKGPARWSAKDKVFVPVQ
jgi:hypothetical protein